MNRPGVLGLTYEISGTHPRCSHGSLLPGGGESFIKAFPGKIVSSNISDNDLYLDRHLPIGAGKIGFRKVLELLKGIGFKGTLNLEVDTDEDRLYGWDLS